MIITNIPETAYIHGNEVNQFIHIQVPMDLVVSDCFASLSGDAKLLYGLLLNRTGLSIRNGWEDDKGRAYINYTVEDVMEDLHISHSKASRLFAELTNVISVGKDDNGKDIYVGLIEKVRVLNKPSRIYVYKVAEVRTFIENYDENLELKAKNVVETAKTQVVSDLGRRTSQKWDDGHHENGTTVTTDIGRRSSYMQDNNNNNTNNQNQIYNQDNNNNHINSILQEMYSDNFEKNDVIDEMDLVRELIKENIDYDCIVEDTHFYDRDMLNQLIEIMVEACVIEGDIIIGGNKIPHELIRSRFEKYDMFVMQYVLMSLKNNTTQVKNTKKYLLATLYNAPNTISSYYSLQVQHDMNSSDCN